jgi:two-component system sensor histidine kinase FlrB
MAFDYSSNVRVIDTDISELGVQHFEHYSPESTSDKTAAAQQQELNALRKQSSRLTHLLQVMPAGVIVLDGKGIVRQANEQARDLLGEPLEGQIWRTIITRSFKPRADDGHEVSLHDGRRVKLSITPLVNEPGQLIVLTDLTETRQLQSRISHLQRLSSLGRMVASLAHQIRTPLSAAMLYAANLTRKNLAPEAQVQFSHKLVDRLKELENQVNDMLLFAKSGDQQVVEPVSIAQLFTSVEGTANTLAHQAKQKIEFTGEDSQGSIMGNLTALQGALTNLIQNAIQINPQGGRVGVNFSVENEQINISVSDQGPGVDPANLSKIVEPFFTTKTHGTGLGLAVVKSVANAHQGNLVITNNAAGGACFCLKLPCLSSASVANLGAQHE